MKDKYIPHEIETKWQKKWLDSNSFATQTDDEKEKYYIKQCNTITPNGYNISTGGQKTKSIPLFCKVCNSCIN